MAPTGWSKETDGERPTPIGHHGEEFFFGRCDLNGPRSKVLPRNVLPKVQDLCVKTPVPCDSVSYAGSED